MRQIVPQHFQEQSPGHIRDQCLVVAQISHRANRFGQDQQPVGVIRFRTGSQRPRDFQTDHHAAQVIVHHRRMAQVRCQHKSFRAFPGMTTSPTLSLPGSKLVRMTTR